MIRRLFISSALVETIAGLVVVSGYADGVGADALFNQPGGIALTSAGDYALIVCRVTITARK